MSALDQLRAYDFEGDQDFKRGLQSILARTDMDASAKEQLVLKAKLFFFTKKTGLTVTMEEYLNSQKTNAPETNTEAQSATKELSFAEIKHLIETNRADEIPNNKTIPDIVHSTLPSVSAAKPRSKPWEAANDSK
ncbi:hypothetical protein M408DRAFT_18832 [Serendipita vermifera MAFF 305830]|uniref:Uncharacterized protein n=1 Tax=Serendipita vermifera MAFF 305830 TaxID=933852 RepID=A0A0C2XY91_SERVB|nr:hypothetical protein M408DRAFT_18832 [Serendipita vermifera MAFF 305830]